MVIGANFGFLTTAVLLSFLVGCTSNKNAGTTSEVDGMKSGFTSGVDATLNVKYDYTPEQLTKLCNSEKDKLVARLDSLAKLDLTQANFNNTYRVLENASTEFNNVVSPLIFLKDVSANEKVRDAASTCSETVSQLYVTLFAREDLYRVLKAASEKTEPLDLEDKRLVEETILAFKRNGLDLKPEARAKLVKLRQEIISKEEDFQKHIKEMTSGFVLVSASELDGLAPDYIKTLTRTPDGQYKITMDKASVFPFLENAKSGSARRRVDQLYNQLGGEKNVKDLEAAIRLRNEAAVLLGFRNHAHYVLDRQMAKTPEKVMAFLQPLVAELKVMGKQDLAELQALKRKEHPNEHDTAIHAWDWRYYETIWKKEKFNIDNQLIKEYFPLDVVLKGMFDIYQTLLGVEFVEVERPETWHPSVKLFQVRKNGEIVAYFYMDLFPREGKYNHFAAFDILKGYRETNGDYRAPVSAIVGNFPPPGGDTPSLLQHDDVETVFHEFGHIMHQTLTKARYSSLSGTSVKTDFVEAPSQMLENWVWEPETLVKLSGHYKDHSKKLPADLIQRMMKAKLVNSGISYLRQAAFALVDMTYHMSPNVDGKSTKIYADMMKNTMLIPIQEGTIPQAGFGHLMGGYDAGYYGYLWSKVYAQDMFTRFEEEGLLNPKTGADYLHNILEPGGVRDPFEMITKFLHREPNQTAFLRSLGLDAVPSTAKGKVSLD
jgi:thimet oligopeptidase